MPGVRGRLPRALAAVATAGMGQSIPTNPVRRVAAPASRGQRAVEPPEKLALDAAVANELARQAEQGYTQGGPDARRTHGKAALSHPIEGREPTTAAPKGQFSREALQAQRSFMDDLPGILKQFGMSAERFHALRSMPADMLEEKESTTMHEIREKIPMPTTETLMQKVIPQEDIGRYIHEFTTIRGYVTRAKDTKQLGDYSSLYDSLRLDYTSTPYNPKKDLSLGIVRFKPVDAEIINIPYGKRMGGVFSWAWPFTGNGFTAALNNQAIPEFLIAAGKSVGMQEGAELYEVYKDGTEKLRAVFHNGKFVAIGD